MMIQDSFSPKEKCRFWKRTGEHTHNSWLSHTEQKNISMSYWNSSASLAEVDVDVGEQRDFPLFVEFIKGVGFFVREKRGWQDGWVRLQVEWSEWTLLSGCSEETPEHQTDHPVDDQLSGASANYSLCPSILSLSAEGGLLSCEKLYWVSQKKLGTWDSLSRRPTAGVSCCEFIINGVNGASPQVFIPCSRAVSTWVDTSLC